jgi:hypothetical protein
LEGKIVLIREMTFLEVGFEEHHLDHILVNH